MIDFVVHGAFMLYAISFMMGLATIFTWVERKQSALMSDRIGSVGVVPSGRASAAKSSEGAVR